MSRLKKILLRMLVTLLMTFGLAASVSALETHDTIDSGFFSVNGGGLASFSGGEIPGNVFPTSSGTFSATSLDFYVPFTAPADYLFLQASWLIDSTVYSLDSYTVEYGYVWPENTFVHVGDLTASMQHPGYSNIYYGTLHNYTWSVDVSNVHVGYSTWYVRLHLTGTFNLQLRHDSGSSFSLSPSSASYDLSLSGKTSSVDAVYNPRSSSIYWNSSLNLFTINTTSTGVQYIRLNSTGDTGNLYRMLANGTVSIPASSVSLSGSVRNPSYSGSGIASSYFGSLVPITFVSTVHSDDSEAVNQLKQINSTLNGMSSNLQTITDDFTAREDVGNDIGGTTSDSQITSGTSGMSTGSASLSDGISGLPSFASVIAPTSGFVGFLTVPVQQIFGFANGYLLYIATAMVLLSVIFWIVRRMGGGDT